MLSKGCCLSLVHTGTLPPVSGACRQPSAYHWRVLVGSCLSKGAPGTSPLLAAHAVLLPVGGMHWWTATCGWSIPAACCLSPPRTGSQLSVSSACKWPAATCRRKLATHGLSLMHSGGLLPVASLCWQLPTVAGTCQWPATTHQHTPAASSLSPGNAGILPHHRCALAACRMAPAHADDLPPDPSV